MKAWCVFMNQKNFSMVSDGAKLSRSQVLESLYYNLSYRLRFPKVYSTEHCFPGILGTLGIKIPCAHKFRKDWVK